MLHHQTKRNEMSHHKHVSRFVLVYIPCTNKNNHTLSIPFQTADAYSHDLSPAVIVYVICYMRVQTIVIPYERLP